MWKFGEQGDEYVSLFPLTFYLTILTWTLTAALDLTCSFLLQAERDKI